MRQLLVHLPRGHGRTALDIARRHDATASALLKAQGVEGDLDLVVLHIPNSALDPLVEELQRLPDLHVTLIPRGVVLLEPPAGHAADEVRDVEPRSPLEILLGGLQSVGSWKAFLAYAAAAGVVVWIAMFTNTLFLLTAAMLIAPYAGPAMNTALASARGDLSLMRRGVLRYGAALAVTSAVTYGLSMLLGQRIATETMIDQSQLSSVAILLPLVAGAAGALNLAQSERSSLVSGAATGMLVAASLAPPAGLVGMAAAIGAWDMVTNAVFVLVLQLFGINLAGALVFRAYGVRHDGVRFPRGRALVFPAALAVSVIALAGLFTFQMIDRPDERRSSRAQRAAASIQELLDEHPLVHPVEVNARFTRADIPDQDTLLVVLYTQRRAGVAGTDDELRDRIRADVHDVLRREDFRVTPLVSVDVLEPPGP